MIIETENKFQLYTIICFILFLTSYYVSVPIANLFLVILILLTFIYILRNKFTLYKEDYYLLVPVILFSMFITFTLIYHNDPIREYDNYSRLLLLVPLYIFFRSFKLDNNILLLLIYLITFTSMLFYLISPAESINLRYSGSSNLPITYGNMIMSLIIFTMIFISFYKNNKKLLFNIISLILLIYLWSITGTRGSLIGFLLSMVFILIISRNTRLMKSLIISLFILVFVSSQLPIKDRLATLYKSISIDSDYSDRSLMEREYMIKKSLNIIKENSLLGVGSKNYENIISFSQKPFDHEFKMPHAHNDFIDLSAKYGMITALLFLLIFLGPIYVAYSSCVTNNTIYSYLCLGHLISNMGFMLTQTLFAHHQSTIIFIIYLYVFLSQVVREKYNE